MGLFRRFGLPIVISSYGKNKNLIPASEYACPVGQQIETIYSVKD